MGRFSVPCKSVQIISLLSNIEFCVKMLVIRLLNTYFFWVLCTRRMKLTSREENLSKINKQAGPNKRKQGGKIRKNN